MYFRLGGGEMTGWSLDYWNKFYEVEKKPSMKHLAEEPETPQHTRMFIVDDYEAGEYRLFFMTEESEESFFDFPGRDEEDFTAPKRGAAKTAGEKAPAEYERLRAELDPEDPEFGRKVNELFQAAGIGGVGGLGKKIALLTYLVENDLAPAIPGALPFHPEPINMFSVVCLYMGDPKAIGLLPDVCAYEAAKYPDDWRAARQGEVITLSLTARIAMERRHPGEAEKDWQAGREFCPEAHAEREKAHLLFRLIESKAKRS